MVISSSRAGAPRYDPWRDLRESWPEVEVRIEPMTGDLLGELRCRRDGVVIALRAGTSAAQRRCTLAHELVHLERGLHECGPWAGREERAVHREVARRLVPADRLLEAIREVGGADDRAALAAALDVDTETLAMRLSLVTARERAALRPLCEQVA